MPTTTITRTINDLKCVSNWDHDTLHTGHGVPLLCGELFLEYVLDNQVAIFSEICKSKHRAYCVGGSWWSAQCVENQLVRI